MSIKQKKSFTVWGRSIRSQMSAAPRVSVGALAAELDVAPSTLYTWLAKENLDDQRKSDVEETLRRLKTGGAPRRLGKTVDRPVDKLKNADPTPDKGDTAQSHGKAFTYPRATGISSTLTGDVALHVVAHICETLRANEACPLQKATPPLEDDGDVEPMDDPDVPPVAPGIDGTE